MSRPINIAVDAKKSLGELDHYWRFVGYDECNYTYVPEGVELLNKFAKLEKEPYYFRTHFMFCTGNCHGAYKFGSTNLYYEDAEGNPHYDFTYYDLVVDAYLKANTKPFLELGFMPMDLVDTGYLAMRRTKGHFQSHNQYKEEGWTCPPKDYDRWHDMIEALMRHLVDRYGADEVKTWYFEMWNEPDGMYWSGTVAEYCKLYDYTEHAIHQVLPEARFSGPAVCGIVEGGRAQMWLKFFLNHCKNGNNYYTNQVGTRLDFITFHVKGGGFPFDPHAPKQLPSAARLVHEVKLGLDAIVEYGYEDREVVLSEADPDGWAAGGCVDNPNMVFRNTEYYASYVAATYNQVEQLARRYHMVVEPLAWAFLFPGERCFDGTRTFSTQGIDKAVFNMFKIFGTLGHEKLAFTSDGVREYDFDHPVDIDGYIEAAKEDAEADVSGFAVRGEDGETQIVVYSHHDDRDRDGVNHVTLRVDGLESGKYQLSHYRIDPEHSNPYAEWVRQGSPLYPQGEQYDRIKARDGLEELEPKREVEAADGSVTLEFDLPEHAVSYLTLKA